MKHRLSGVVFVIASSIVAQTPGAARGSFASENPLAAEHLDSLPADIRRAVAQREQACRKAAAGHYFSTSIEASGHRFVVLHFEEFYCPGSRKICDAAGCLHEVFLDTGGRRVRVFAANAKEITMTNAAGVAGLEMFRAGIRTLFCWNGRSFRPAVNRNKNEYQTISLNAQVC